MVPLATIPLATLHVACTRCDRRGRYPIATLIRRHGDISVFELLDLLTTGCPIRAPSPSVYNRCGAHCPELARLAGIPRQSGPDPSIA